MLCKFNNCSNSIIPRRKYCELHRTSRNFCVEPGCNKRKQGKSNKCLKHGGGYKCVETGCTKFSKGKDDKCVKHGGGVRCAEPECKKSAIFKSDKCVKHGGGTRCVEPGCNKIAVDKSYKCKLHGGGRRCVESGCKKSSRGKTDKCIEHGGGVRCIEPGCNKSAQGKTNKCVEHGGGSRCIESGCKKSAQGKTNTCIEHGGGSRCVEIGCKKSAIGKTNKCVEHGGGDRCIEPGCNKSAVDKSYKCKLHGGGSRCPNCIDWVDSRCGSIKYDGYCATCFKRIFPEDSRSTIIYQHSKEIRVRNAITEASNINTLFQGFVHDKPLYTGNCDCTHRRRVDHRKLIGNTVLAVETDEYAHRGYDEKDEEIRYDDLYMIHSGKWIFIRFNPDMTITQTTDIEDRIIVLLEVIEKQIKRIISEENKDLVEIIKLYY